MQTAVIKYIWLNGCQGSSHANASESVRTSYWNALLANWKIWTLPQVNIHFIIFFIQPITRHPVEKVFFFSIIRWLSNRVLYGNFHHNHCNFCKAETKTFVLTNSISNAQYPQIVNINLVAPQYRVLFANLVALVWNSYLASIKKK